MTWASLGLVFDLLDVAVFVGLDLQLASLLAPSLHGLCEQTRTRVKSHLQTMRVFTLGDARAFWGLASKISPLGSMLKFDADVKNLDRASPMWKPLMPGGLTQGVGKDYEKHLLECKSVSFPTKQRQIQWFDQGWISGRTHSYLFHLNHPKTRYCWISCLLMVHPSVSHRIVWWGVGGKRILLWCCVHHLPSSLVSGTGGW